MPRWLAMLIKFSITAALLFILLLRIHPGAIFAALKDFSVFSITAATLLVTLQAFAAGLRWHLILRLLGQPIAIARTLQLFWMGMFFAAVLPGGIAGDGVRIWMLHRDDVSVSKAFSSVLIDRVIGLIGLLMLLAVDLPFATGVAPNTLTRLASAAVIAVGIGVLILIPVMLRLPTWLANNRFIARLRFLAADLRNVSRSPRNLIALLCISILAMLLNALAFYLLMRGVSPGVQMADGIALALVVILTLTLPISIGGWGIREVATVALFAGLGVSSSEAVAVSLVVGIIGIFVSLPGGLVWLKQAKMAGPIARPLA